MRDHLLDSSGVVALRPQSLEVRTVYICGVGGFKFAADHVRLRVGWSALLPFFPCENQIGSNAHFILDYKGYTKNTERFSVRNCSESIDVYLEEVQHGRGESHARNVDRFTRPPMMLCGAAVRLVR